MARVSIPLVVLLVLGSAAPAAASTREAAPAASCVSEAPNAVTAKAAARRCGIRVENLSARTDRAKVYANPSGTQTFEATALPTRVKRPDGSWVPIDPTLTSTSGDIRPIATTAAVRFSRGGDDPLVTVGEGPTAWTLRWPAPLPAPRIEGENAIYPNVLAGVDLVMRALTDGFSHVLVVHDATAAANPALREIHYLTSGKQIEARGAALMWDSTPGGAPSSAAEPGDAARRTEIPTRMQNNDLVVVPDRKILTDPKTTYPVYIDPPFHEGFSHWAYANNYNVNNGDGRAWVGLDPWAGIIYRSYFDFDISYIGGSYVLSASVGAVLSHSWSCYPTPVYLFRSGNVISEPRSPWHSVPLDYYLDGVSANAHKGIDACGEQPDAPMWFGGNLLGDVRNAVASYWFFYSVGFCACTDPWAFTDEFYTDRWKKIHPGSLALNIEFTNYPSVSGQATTPATPCVTGPGRPVMSTATPLLNATLTDPDPGAVLQADFQYSVNGGPWVALPRTGGQASGLTHVVQMPSIAGASYVAWRVLAWDGNVTSLNWSPICEFAVDSTPPKAPVLNTSGLPAYPSSPPSTVKVGTPVAVPISPGSGDTDIAGYWYAVSTSQQSPPRQFYVAAAANGTATLSVVPVASNPSSNWLTVQAVDRAGNFSPEVVHRFRARSA